MRNRVTRSTRRRRRYPVENAAAIGSALTAAGFLILTFVCVGCFDIPSHPDPQGLAFALCLVGAIGLGTLGLGLANLWLGIVGQVR